MLFQTFTLKLELKYKYLLLEEIFLFYVYKWSAWFSILSTFKVKPVMNLKFYNYLVLKIYHNIRQTVKTKKGFVYKNNFNSKMIKNVSHTFTDKKHSGIIILSGGSVAAHLNFFLF